MTLIDEIKNLQTLYEMMKNEIILDLGNSKSEDMGNYTFSFCCGLVQGLEETNQVKTVGKLMEVILRLGI